jgi:hypothetical protein
MCPGHTWHEKFLIDVDEDGYEIEKRIRRPKNPRMIDIEVLPDEEEAERIEEQEEEGIMYRVSEKGIKLDFIERVKRSVYSRRFCLSSLSNNSCRENEEMAMKRAVMERYYVYVRQKHDELTAKAHAFYSSQDPDVLDDDTTAAILNSRTIAEREAAANLISFAQGNSTEVQNNRINLLIDQLKANAPEELPSAETEIASLRSLQKLIELRISDLKTQSANTPSPDTHPIDVEAMADQPTDQFAST